jgi:aminoglycoside phosphotransferase family enzyme
VRYPYLDFSTLAARETNCRAEVRLNRRLAPDVYRGVRALLRRPDGQLVLGEPEQGPQGGEGGAEVVDWLVEMRRLPDSAMLDVALAEKRVARAQIEAVGRRLAGFYEAAERPRLSPAVHLAELHRQQALNRAILTARDFMLDHGRGERLLDAVEAALERQAPALSARVAAGLVLEGHGDLRPEHVCLTDPPVIIDCLEFNRTLRLVDPYDELAFLDLECRRLGADWVGPLLVETVAARIGHRPSPALAAFYLAFRALVRARLTLVHLLEPAPREPQKWQPLARQYLELAERALADAGDVTPAPPEAR